MGSADCKAINSKSGKKRLAGSKTITLKPGKYIFRVTNKNVPYQLGFYLRGAGVGRLTLPKVSGATSSRGNRGITTSRSKRAIIIIHAP